MKKIWFGIAVLIATVTVVGLASHFSFARTKVHATQPCKRSDAFAIAKFDHSLLNGLLKKYVDANGMVAYGKWKSSLKDMRGLEVYLEKMGCVDRTKKASKKARLAFWINAYNALTIFGILREYPTTSIRNHAARFGGYNIWKDLLLWVDRGYVSLDDIEHNILRKMGEPRIHFAVNCASIGCPPLSNHAYTTENLEKQLAANARRFFSKRSNFQVDKARRTIFVSKLLQWYGSDFAKSPQDQIRQLIEYLPKFQSLRWLQNADFRVRYLDYDWGLNDRKTASR